MHNCRLKSDKPDTLMLERLPEFATNHPLLIVMFAGLVIALIVTEIRHLNRWNQIHDIPNVFVTDGARNILPSAVEPASKPLKDWKDSELAVYCKNGMVSEQICRKLVKAGFSKVHWLRGGLTAWVGDQLPVTRAKK